MDHPLLGFEHGGIALVAAASVIHDGVKLQPKRKDPTWLESARLWVALVGDPSTLKSPAIGKATRHVRRLDEKLAEQNEAEYAQWRQKHDDWKVEKKKDGGLIRRNIKKIAGSGGATNKG